MKNTILRLAFCAALPVLAQQKATVIVHPDQGKQVINKEIYGGLWVGENSSIPNVKGYRTDVLEALKKLKAPCCAGRVVALLTNIIGWTVSDRVRIDRRW